MKINSCLFPKYKEDFHICVFPSVSAYRISIKFYFNPNLRNSKLAFGSFRYGGRRQETSKKWNILYSWNISQPEYQDICIYFFFLQSPMYDIIRPTWMLHAQKMCHSSGTKSLGIYPFFNYTVSKPASGWGTGVKGKVNIFFKVTGCMNNLCKMPS